MFGPQDSVRYLLAEPLFLEIPPCSSRHEVLGDLAWSGRMVCQSASANLVTKGARVDDLMTFPAVGRTKTGLATLELLVLDSSF